MNIKKVAEELRIDFHTVEPIGNHETLRHKVYLYEGDEDKFVLKLYCKKGRMQRELDAFKLVAKLLLKGPRAIKYGNLENGTEYICMTYIEGENAEKALLEEDEMLALYCSLGEYAGRLHTVTKERLPGYVDRFLQVVANMYNEAIGNSMERQYTELIKEAYSIFLKNSKEVSFENINFGYIHGDFDLRNVLVNNGVLNGLVDFECAGFGNTEIALMQIYRKRFLNNSGYRDAFFEGYQKIKRINDEFYDRITLYLLADSIKNCAWSYIEDKNYFLENIESIKKIINI